MRFYPFDGQRVLTARTIYGRIIRTPFTRQCLAIEGRWLLVRLYPYSPFIRVTKRSVP